MKAESDREEAKGKDFKPLSFGGLLYTLMWLMCLIPLSFILDFRETPAPCLGCPGPPLPGYGRLLLRLSVLLPLGGVGQREGAQREAIPKTDEELGIQLPLERGQGVTVLRVGPVFSISAWVLTDPALVGLHWKRNGSLGCLRLNLECCPSCSKKRTHILLGSAVKRAAVVV